jgi:uncharacterized membrane protein
VKCTLCDKNFADSTQDRRRHLGLCPAVDKIPAAFRQAGEEAVAMKNQKSRERMRNLRKNRKEAVEPVTEQAVRSIAVPNVSEIAENATVVSISTSHDVFV